MKKKILSLLAVSTLVLAACGGEEEAIEEPTDGTRQIELNETHIANTEESLEEEQEKYDQAEYEALKEVHEENIKMMERRISGYEAENELLEETLIYNDEFKTVQGTAVYTKLDEGMVNENTLVSSFNNSILSTLKKYNEVISNGAILINALPFEEDGDKFPIISVYYSQESIDELDFESDEDLYAFINADYVDVHFVLEDYLEGHGDFSEVPDIFTVYNGKLY